MTERRESENIVFVVSRAVNKYFHICLHMYETRILKNRYSNIKPSSNCLQELLFTCPTFSVLSLDIFKSIECFR